jgi:hypothetical protein
MNWERRITDRIGAAPPHILHFALPVLHFAFNPAARNASDPIKLAATDLAASSHQAMPGTHQKKQARR